MGFWAFGVSFIYIGLNPGGAHRLHLDGATFARLPNTGGRGSARLNVLRARIGWCISYILHPTSYMAGGAAWERRDVSRGGLSHKELSCPPQTRAPSYRSCEEAHASMCKSVSSVWRGSWTAVLCAPVNLFDTTKDNC